MSSRDSFSESVRERVCVLENDRRGVGLDSLGIGAVDAMMRKAAAV